MVVHLPTAGNQPRDMLRSIFLQFSVSALIAAVGVKARIAMLVGNVKVSLLVICSITRCCIYGQKKDVEEINSSGCNNSSIQLRKEKKTLS